MKFGPSEKTKERVSQAKHAAATYFDLESVGKNCFFYSDVQADRIIKITWRVDETEVSFGLLHMLLLFFGHIGYGLKSKVVQFETFHPVSSRALWRIRFLQFLGQSIQIMAIFVMLMGVIVLFIVGIMGLSSLGGGPVAQDDRRSAISSFIGAIILLGGGFAARRLAPRLGLIGSMKAIGRWPIQFYKMQTLKK